jgi:hypothetical protein
MEWFGFVFGGFTVILGFIVKYITKGRDQFREIEDIILEELNIAFNEYGNSIFQDFIEEERDKSINRIARLHIAMSYDMNKLIFVETFLKRSFFYLLSGFVLIIISVIIGNYLPIKDSPVYNLSRPILYLWLPLLILIGGSVVCGFTYKYTEFLEDMKRKYKGNKY